MMKLKQKVNVETELMIDIDAQSAKWFTEEQIEHGFIDAHQLHKVLGIGTYFKRWLDRRTAKYNLVERVNYVTLESGKIALTTETAILIIHDERARQNPVFKEVFEFLTSLMQKEVVFIDARKEIEFATLLLKVLHGITEIRTQVRVGKYILDFYLPEEDICVEYDEVYHKYQSFKDNVRELVIRKFKPNIQFVRVKEGLEAEGLNQILLAILHNRGY